MIHNISIATADDVTYFGDDVKYITCIFTQGNYHLGILSQFVRKDYLFQTNVLVNFLKTDLGTHPWPQSLDTTTFYSTIK